MLPLTGTSTNMTSLLLMPQAKTWDIGVGPFCTRQVYFLDIPWGVLFEKSDDPDDPNCSGSQNRIRPICSIKVMRSVNC